MYFCIYDMRRHIKNHYWTTSWVILILFWRYHKIWDVFTAGLLADFIHNLATVRRPLSSWESYSSPRSGSNILYIDVLNRDSCTHFTKSPPPSSADCPVISSRISTPSWKTKFLHLSPLHTANSNFFSHSLIS